MSEPGEIALWIWISLWSGIGIGLIGMLAIFAWSLIRKALRVVEDASAISMGISYDTFDGAALSRAPLAVLQPMAQVRLREAARRTRRDERRQRRREERIARARRITSVDATTVEWPAEWYR